MHSLERIRTPIGGVWMYPLGVLGCDLVKRRAWSEHGKVGGKQSGLLLRRWGTKKIERYPWSKGGKNPTFSGRCIGIWVLGFDAKIQVLWIKLWFNSRCHHMYSSRQLSSTHSYPHWRCMNVPSWRAWKKRGLGVNMAKWKQTKWTTLPNMRY